MEGKFRDKLRNLSAITVGLSLMLLFIVGLLEEVVGIPPEICQIIFKFHIMSWVGFIIID